MNKVVIYNDRWCSGGVESMIVSLLTHSDFSDINITILVGQKETNIYDSCLDKIGLKIVPILGKIISNPIKRDLMVLKRLKSFLREMNPDIFHINVCNSIGFKYAKIAKKCFKCVTIVHSHNTKIENDKFGLKKLAHNYYKRLSKFSDINIACSNAAGKFMFKSNYMVLNNGVDLDRFRYNTESRNRTRNELGYDYDDVVLLNVGRFTEQKNQIILFDIIKSLEKKYKLLLVGEGPLKKFFVERIRVLNLNDRVRILEPTKRIEDIYNSADIFLLPSLHEGLPVVGIEAQANGLKCIFSNGISNEVVMSNNSYMICPNSIDEWAKLISTIDISRIDVSKEIIEKGYSVNQSSEKLHLIYCER